MTISGKKDANDQARGVRCWLATHPAGQLGATYALLHDKTAQGRNGGEGQQTRSAQEIQGQIGAEQLAVEHINPLKTQ